MSTALLPHRKQRAGGRISPWGSYLLIAPSLLILAVFTLYPLLRSAWLSLFEADLAHKVPIWNGFGNYRDLFADQTFHRVLLNNLYFALGTAPVSVALAMFLAVVVNQKLAGSGALRSAFFYPTVLPMVSAASIWLFLYTPQYGLFARILQWFGLGVPNWLGDPRWVMPALILTAIWKSTGFYMVFFLAGLQNLPTDVYEAADLDGASAWKAFWRITFPLVMPTTLFVITIAAVDTVKLVDHIFVMTQGGPGDASKILLYYLYLQAFKFFDKGMAATITVLLVLVLIIVGIFNTQVLDKRVHYD